MNRTGLVLRALGLLLWVAAGLKAYGLAIESVSAEGFFAATWMQVGLVWLEALLGLWLIAGPGSLLAWSAACLVFTSFAIVSATQGLIGQASCGCFGRVALHPWYAFGIDIGALVALAVGMPPRPLGIRAEQYAQNTPEYASCTAWCGKMYAQTCLTNCDDCGGNNSPKDTNGNACGGVPPGCTNWCKCSCPVQNAEGFWVCSCQKGNYAPPP